MKFSEKEEVARQVFPLRLHPMILFGRQNLLLEIEFAQGTQLPGILWRASPLKFIVLFSLRIEMR